MKNTEVSLHVNLSSQVKFLVELVKYTSKTPLKNGRYTTMVCTALFGKRLLPKVNSSSIWGKKGIQEFVVTWLKWFWLVEVLAFGAYVFHLVLRVSCFCLFFLVLGWAKTFNY